MIEMFKIKNELASPIIDSMFLRTMDYCLETLSYWSPRLWSLLPEKIK